MTIREDSLNLALITDSYWPLIGGIENAVHSLCCTLPENIKCKIVTYNTPKKYKTLFQHYWCTNSGPATDPENHSILYLNTSIFKKTLLLPLLFWNIPGIRHFRSPKLYDILYFFYSLAFKDTLKRYLGDIRIVHSFSTSYLARLASEICKEQHIKCIHSPAIHFGRWGDSPEQLKSYISGNLIICFTEYLKKQLISRVHITDRTDMTVIPPFSVSCQLSDKIQSPVNGAYILFLGRREVHKGLFLLISAFSRIDTNAKLVIAGPGEKIINSNQSIVDLGEISDQIKAVLLKNCQFLVVLTNDESFGIVFTEAMSYGKPVISFDIPPVNEIVQNENSGILVPQNDPAAIAGALDRLLKNQKLKKQMGIEAQKRYDTFYSPKVIVPKIVDIYEKVVESQLEP